MTVKHGEVHDGGRLRWCEGCGHDHAPLYPCENFDTETLAQVASDTEKFRANTRSAAWWNKQIAKGRMSQDDAAIAMALYGAPTEP